MTEIQYLNEHLIPFYVGQLGVVGIFVGAIFSMISYYNTFKNKDLSQQHTWLKMSRIGYLIHGFSVFLVIGTMFYVMFNHYYEYHYAWGHTDNELERKFLFAAFWEGQEGSFLLWMFWHVIIGFMLIRTAKTWESPVMFVLSMIQVFLSSMILGRYIGFGEWVYKFGSNPMLLTRDVMQIPLFQNPDYLTKLEGRGLNPLLQNYWMTIHPPTLFFGFALCSVPFCYFMAGLLTRRYEEVLEPVLPWTLLNGAILGTGILMGGAWAYEALSFGGYWAWDPVENMSLVPWLMLIGGLHTILIARATGYSLRASYIFILAAFVLVIYSTFLTRSGVLGETSVHAFTEMGLELQLLLFLLFFTIYPAFLLIKNYKKIETHQEEEALPSKEFWMFIGSLVFLFSATLITFTTSVPVYNKLFDVVNSTFHTQWKHLSPPVDVIAHYNKSQLWIGVFIGLLSGFTQYLRFRNLNWEIYKKTFLKHVFISILISIGITYLYTLWINTFTWQYILLLFAGILTIITNLDYLFTFLKFNIKQSASVMSHLGFGLMIIGIMASGLNKRWISNNTFAMQGILEKEQLKKNILLMRNETMLMNDYEVKYNRDSMFQHSRTFTVDYTQRDKNQKIINQFSLIPNILYDRGFSKIAATNPSTKHYWNKDIFTHIAALPPAEMDAKVAKEIEDTLHYKNFDLAVGDTFETRNFKMLINEVIDLQKVSGFELKDKDFGIGAKMTFVDLNTDKKYNVEPKVVVKDGVVYSIADNINTLSLKLKIDNDFLIALENGARKSTSTDKKMKINESVKVNNHTYKITSINKIDKHPQMVQGDLGVLVDVKDESGNIYKPGIIIRENSIIPMTPISLDEKTNIIMASIDPKDESFLIKFADKINKSAKLPVSIADNAPPTNFIVLEAIEFPGINYFWIGCSLMMFGLTLAMFVRMKSKFAR